MEGLFEELPRFLVGTACRWAFHQDTLGHSQHLFMPGLLLFFLFLSRFLWLTANLNPSYLLNPLYVLYALDELADPFPNECHSIIASIGLHELLHHLQADHYLLKLVAF